MMQHHIFAALLVNLVWSAHSSNPHFWDILRNSECLNMDDIMNGLGWNSRSINPYETNPAGVNIPRDQQCYATIINPEADFTVEKMKYVLSDMTV